MTGKIEVLYVDDEPDIRTIAAFALGLDDGIAVRSLGSGAEALALLDAGAWRPDVVLLDVMMPEMDGPTLFLKLRERTDFADVPVIFMTARARSDDIARYLAQGAIGVVTKPFDPMTLADEIRSLLRVSAG